MSQETVNYNSFAYLDGRGVGNNMRLSPDQKLRIPACPYETVRDVFHWALGLVDGLSGNFSSSYAEAVTMDDV